MMTQDQTLRSALEAMGGSMVIWSKEGKAVYTSPSFLEDFSLQASEVEGYDRHNLENNWLDRGIVLLPGPPQEVVTQEGRHFERRSTLLSNGGQWDQFYDLSQQWEQAKKHEEYLGVAIHDLRAPLANVRSYSSLLLGRHQTIDSKVQRSIEVIARNADRALRLLQLFFDSVRAQTGELEIERQPVSLTSLIQEITTTRRPNAAEKGVDLRVCVPEHLPTIIGDQARLRYALVAFLDFSIARSPPNQGVEVQCEAAPLQVKIRFTDFGPVLSAEQRGIIFDTQEQALHERRLGAGFAVAVAHTVLQVHDCQVYIESAPAKTSFCLSFRC